MANKAGANGQTRLGYGALGVSHIARSLGFYCDEPAKEVLAGSGYAGLAQGMPGSLRCRPALPRPGEHRVDGLHDRYRLVQHHGALEQPGPQTALDLVGFVTQTVAPVRGFVPNRGPAVIGQRERR